MILRLTPILLAVAYGLIMYHLSAWRTKARLSANSTELADPVIKNLTDRMAAALELPRIRVHLYEVEMVNGLAAPDGRIFLTRGLYDKYRLGAVSAEELVSVIAHELGHVALGHTRRRMIDFSGQNAMRAVLNSLIGRFIPFIGPWVVDVLMSLVAARLSRDAEFEADAYAAALLVKSGIGTAPQKSLLEKLTDLAGGANRQMPAWMMSHPKTPKRIEAIEALENKWQA